MANASTKRIALLGFELESNRFAPVVGKTEFTGKLVLKGADMMADLATENPRSPGTLVGFTRTMDKTGSWTPVPIMVAGAGAAGAVEHAYYLEIKDEMLRRLEAEMPVDGVYFCEHGAAVTTEISDPDGDLFASVRALVGPDVPLVSTLDLHANISDKMVGSTDLLVAYRTNPHVDHFERGAEAARAMVELMAGLNTESAFIRLPLQAPQVTQLTAAGPYGEIIDIGQDRLDETILNVSICSGFTYGDTPENGMAFIVTTRGDKGQARRLCRELAEHAWAERHRFVPRLTSLDDCICRAVEVGDDVALSPILIADVADNPGGGGRGNTTWLLRGLHEAGAKDAVLGIFFDAALAAEAHALGVGETFGARFNRDEASTYSEPFEAEATVRTLSSGDLVGRPGGSVAGRTVALGPTAVLELGGVIVVVVSKRVQCFDSGFFETFGVDVKAARTVVVKSRGHFRAGFAHLYQPDQIIEADAPGLTSPNLANFTFAGYQRPIFPLDPETTWQPPGW